MNSGKANGINEKITGAEIMTQKQFFDNFEKQNFSQALNIFSQLDKEEQEAIFQQLYYLSREANTPIAISVLYRKLHDGKTFEDFYNAWLPPIEYSKPFKVGNKLYYHYSNIPTRVINAVSATDSTEIISIGMLWGTEKEVEKLFEQVKNDNSNQVRHDKISEVADKITAKTYVVKSDLNIGN